VCKIRQSGGIITLVSRQIIFIRWKECASENLRTYRAIWKTHYEDAL
jgi:hypothetical protein